MLSNLLIYFHFTIKLIVTNLFLTFIKKRKISESICGYCKIIHKWLFNEREPSQQYISCVAD